jgi:hypothetical protein
MEENTRARVTSNGKVTPGGIERVLCDSVEETENDDKAIIGISYGRNVLL